MYNSSSSLLFKSNRCTFTVALPSEIWWQFVGWIKLLPLSKVKRLRSTFNYCFKQSFVYLRCPLFSQLRSKQINTMQFLLILTRSFGLIFLNMGGAHYVIGACFSFISANCLHCYSIYVWRDFLVGKFMIMPIIVEYCVVIIFLSTGEFGVEI